MPCCLSKEEAKIVVARFAGTYGVFSLDILGVLSKYSTFMPSNAFILSHTDYLCQKSILQNAGNRLILQSKNACQLDFYGTNPTKENVLYICYQVLGAMQRENLRLQLELQMQILA